MKYSLKHAYIGAFLALLAVALPYGANAQSYYNDYNTSQSRIETLLRELTRLQNQLAERRGTNLSGCFQTENIEYCYDRESDYSRSSYNDRYAYSSSQYDYDYSDSYNDYDYDYSDNYYDEPRYRDDRYNDNYSSNNYSNNYYSDNRRSNSYDRDRDDRAIDQIEVSFSNDRAYVWVYYQSGRQQNFVYRTQNERTIISSLAGDLDRSARSIEGFINWDY